MRVLVVTTSYPRSATDVAGAFVAAQVDHLRAGGAAVDVVAPSSFGHLGIAYGDGIVNNLRRAPWKVAALPVFVGRFRRAARRRSPQADVVHAHWLPCAYVARSTNKPIVLQLWGSDVELARRMPRLFRPIIRAASIVVCASQALAEDARELGATDVRVIPNGVDASPTIVEHELPPHVLYVGRLSEEKGIRDLAAALGDLPLRVVGDGPLRHLLPQTQGFVAPADVGASYDRAAVVVVPSRREGYGVVAREAMAHGRAVVATRVGGLVDALEHEVTGLLVPPGDPVALRAAVQRLLDDAELRQRLGRAAHAHAVAELGWDRAVERLLSVYADAVR